MRSFFVFCIITFIYLSSDIFSQQKISEINNGFTVELNFEEPKFSDVKNSVITIRDYFEFTDISNPGTFKLPSKTLLMAIPAYTKPEIKLSNKVEEQLDNIIPALHPNLKKLNDSTLVDEAVDFAEAKYDYTQKDDFEIIGYTWQGEYYCLVIKINTHKFDIKKNQITRIIKANIDVVFENNQKIDLKQMDGSFTDHLGSIFINNSIAKQFATEQPLLLQDTTGSWISYESEYLKLGTVKDELFRITRSDLEAKGINVNLINPKTFRLIESGEEIPITVVGQEDNSFDVNDYIEFYGTINYSKKSHRVINNSSEPYNEYLDRYSDTTFYFLTWGQQDGLRIQIQNVFNSGLSDSLVYHTSTSHIETNKVYFNANTDEISNQMPNWFNNKTWYNSQTTWLYNNTTRNYNFNTGDLVPNKIAKFYFKVVSGGSNIINNAHQVTLSVNNVLIDSQSINRNQQLLLTGQLNTDQFVTNPNVMSVKNFSNGSNPNFLAVDWYEIEYPAYLKLGSDFLKINVSEDISNGLKVIKIQNATTSTYEIYKVKPYLKKIENYQVNINLLLFTDTVSAGDQYIISSSSNIGDPEYYYKKQFVNLRSIVDQADYLAITHPKFIQAVNNYVNYVSSIYNVTKDIISVEDIYDEFSFGYPQPEGIRLFANVTYTNRQNPKPKYLTLIGDANYDYKLYRFKSDGVIGGGNYVPSFGNPISDNWFAIWDESSIPLPQLRVGRIPINASEDLDYYLSKVQNNYLQQYDEWNKRYIFFSGGRADFPDELVQLKSVNDQIIINNVKPAPLSGSAVHFFKTTNPLSDFGPYPPEFISSTIDEGGVFISYLGHSGTATWDNSISETTQLKNSVNKNPLITDFGCSTNKFGEPDIVSFGERFLLNNEAQAIGYIGNSSLGFTTTSLTVPIYFYEIILKSNSKEIGEAHLSAKDSMFVKIGSSGVFKLFALTNTLIGDPLVRIKIPQKPNLKISNKDLLFLNSVINDNQDSIELKIVINNFGTKDTSRFNYSIQHIFNNNVIKTFSSRKTLPEFKDTVSIWLSIKNLPGEHLLSVNLDTAQEVAEIYEDDNALISAFNVYSTALRDLVKHRNENPVVNRLRILNPSLGDNQNFNIKIQLADNESFFNFLEFTIPADSFYNDFTIPQQTLNKRFWFRYKIDENNAQFSLNKSFIYSIGFPFQLSDSLSFSNQELIGLKYGQNSVNISDKLLNISVTSAGFEAGATCVISKDGINLLANTFFAGMGIIVFDDVTFDVDTSTYFNLFNNPANVTALINLINSIPQGKIVAMGVSDDAANNITVALKDAIKTLGSTKIDSLTFRGSWALIGKKGTSPGSVLEQVKGRYDGLIYIDSTFVVKQSVGQMITSEIGPSSDWRNIKVNQIIPAETSINHYVYGIKNDVDTDSLGILTITNGTSDLSFVNSKIYPRLKIKSEFNASAEGISPELSSLGIDYAGLPELGTNFQVVGLDADTIQAGGNINLTFAVYNVGEVKADSFNVKVDVVNSNNLIDTTFSFFVGSLNSDAKRIFDLNYQIRGNDNEKKFVINIDSENKISEYFEDNNFYTKDFYVLPDLVSPTLKITFDEQEVVNGDFVSDNPNIKIALSDESPVPITDTSAVKIYLNEDPVYYNANPNTISFTVNSTNPKFIVEYKPELEDGEYLLRVVGKDQNGNLADSASSEIYFIVSSESKLHEVYNYPNPFTNDTYFTFKLSQIPQEVKIRIYTIAGRMIKEIVRNSTELNYDLNRIYWDGKDADGDILANGTYLYKVFIKNDTNVESVTQKLVIVK